MIADRLRTERLSNFCHSTKAVNRFTGSQPAHYLQQLCIQKDTHLKTPYTDQGPTANPCGDVIKMHHTHFFGCKNIRWYAESVRELRLKGCVSPDEQPGRGGGWGTVPPSPLRRFGTSPVIKPQHLVSRSAMLQEGSVLFCRRIKHKTYCLIDYHWVEAASLFSNTPRWNSLCLWPSLVCRLDYRKKSSERFLLKNILETT